MVRARNLLEGITAPMCSGFSIHERRKRTSSSRRRGFFNARTDDCKGMSLPGGTASVRECQKTVTKRYRSKPIRSSKTVPRPARPGVPQFGDKTMRQIIFSAWSNAKPDPFAAALGGSPVTEEVLDLGEET